MTAMMTGNANWGIWCALKPTIIAMIKTMAKMGKPVIIQLKTLAFN